MGMKKGTDIRPAQGALGVLLPGLGAVATTVIAGVEAVRRGLGNKKPIGSLTQMGTIRLGKRTENRNPKISEFVPLAKLDDLRFGAWDIFPDNAYEAASHAGVLSREELLELGFQPDRLPAVVHPYFIGNDLTQVWREKYVIDLFGLAPEAAQRDYPMLWEWLVRHVRPKRALNNRALYRNN